jgi:hypothetical protein
MIGTMAPKRARKTFKGNGEKRDGGQHLALPWVVLDSVGYRRASHTARSLLIDLGRQYTGFNNGKLVACQKYLEPMGWRSNSTISRALAELVDCRLLIETRKGTRPNKASWYALSWLDLDQEAGLDIDPKCYKRAHRGGYLNPDKPDKERSTARTRTATEARRLGRTKQVAEQPASLSPSDGPAGPFVAPSHGEGSLIHAPMDGAIRGDIDPSSAPSHGHYLETPSAVGVAGSGPEFDLGNLMFRLQASPAAGRFGQFTGARM